MRQVAVVPKGLPSSSKSTIGEGSLRSRPPGTPMPFLRSGPLDSGLSTLDYEGEVRANSDVTVGHFSLSRIQVRVRLVLRSIIDTRGVIDIRRRTSWQFTLRHRTKFRHR